MLSVVVSSKKKRYISMIAHSFNNVLVLKDLFHPQHILFIYVGLSFLLQKGSKILFNG